MRYLIIAITAILITSAETYTSNLISIQTTKTFAGDTGKFSILMRNEVTVNGLNFVLRYNPNLITPLSAKPAGKAALLTGSRASFFGDDRISFLVYDEGTNFLSVDSDKVFDVEYVVKDTLHDTVSTPLTFTEGIVADSSIASIPFDYTDGIILLSPMVGVKPINSGIPAMFYLHQNYPNPFNPTTTIRYELPVQCRVKLRIYNLLGQVVSTISDEIQTAGYKSLEWKANGVASGVYFYRLEATSISDPGRMFSQTRKMLTLK